MRLGTRLLPKLCFGNPCVSVRSRYQIHEPNVAHFITSTVIAWLLIFTKAIRCDIIVESLEYCRAHKALKIYAWVILDNHLHTILAAPNLSRVIADFNVTPLAD